LIFTIVLLYSAAIKAKQKITKLSEINKNIVVVTLDPIGF